MARISWDVVQDVEAVDKEYLTYVVRQAGVAEAKIAGFEREALQKNSYGGGGVNRFRLDYLQGNSEQAPESIILKISRPNLKSANEPGYVCREANCYRHGLFDLLSNSLYVPKAYHTVMWPEQDECWIWMEDLGENAFHQIWTVQMVEKAVRDIAHLHAQWWERTNELERFPYLLHHAQAMFQRQYAEEIKQAYSAIDTHRSGAAIKRVYTPQRERLLLKLQDIEDVVYAKLNALPQTLLHHDFYPPNIAFYDGKTTLIDWAYVGIGTPGAELCIMSLFCRYFVPDFVGNEEELLAETLWRALHNDHGLPIRHDEVLKGYHLGYALRTSFFMLVALMGILNEQPADARTDADFSDTELWLQRSETAFRKLEGAVEGAGIL